MNFHVTDTMYYSLNTHDHDFTEFEWVSNTVHKSICGCGASIQQGHVVAPESFQNGEIYATCLDCGGRATQGFFTTNSIDLFTLREDGYYYANETRMIGNTLFLDYNDYLIYKEAINEN